MSINESLSLFFLPSLSDLHVLPEQVNPWALLLSVMAAFFLISLSFWHRHVLQKKTRGWQLSPSVINAITCSLGLAIVPWINVLSTPQFIELGFIPTLLFLPSLVTFILCYFSLKIVSNCFNSGIKILIASLSVTLAILLQTLLSFSGINGVTIVHFDAATFVMTGTFSSLFFILAFWINFSVKKNNLWERNLSRALLSGAIVSFTVLFIVLFLRKTVALSIESTRIAANVLNQDEIQFFLILIISFLAIINYLINEFYSLKDKFKYLNEEKKHLDSVMQTMTQAIIVIDKKGIINFYNRAAEDIFGWYEQEIIGRNIQLLIADEYKNRNTRYLHHFLDNIDATTKIEKEAIAKKKDGSFSPIKLTISHRSYQQNNDFVVVISDISEQRHLANALKENAKQYRSLISNLPCMAFREMTGIAWHIVYISDIAKLITGYSASTLTGENGSSHFIESIHEDDIDHYKNVRERASRENGKYDCEYRFITRNREEKWFWEIGHSYRAEDGTHWIDGIIIDVTEKQLAEQELNNKQRQLEISTQSKIMFLTSLNNEFRSPINATLHLIQNLIDKEKNLTYRQHFETIKASSESLLTVFNDILDTSQLENDSLPIQLTDFSLIQLCRQIEFIGKEKVSINGSDVTLFYDKKMAENFVGDARRIKQLLQNMMRNALMKTSAINIGLHIFPVNNIVRFAVSSFSMADKNKAEEIDKNYIPCTTLTSQLVDLMQGNLWIDGTSVNQSIIYADLPIVSAKAKNNTTPQNHPHYSFPAVEILVIDDGQKNLQELRDMSLRQGLNVLTCHNISLAKDIIKTQQVDIVFLDAYLQDDISLTVNMLHLWAQQSQKKSLQVIAMKFAVDMTPAKKWKERGFNWVIDKPFKYKDVFKVLSDCLGLDDFNNKVALLSSVRGDPKTKIFDANYAARHWPTSEILFSVVRRFYHQYKNLPLDIEKAINSQPDALNLLLCNAKTSAHYLGFQQIEIDLNKIIKSIELGEIKKISSQIENLEITLAASIENIMATLGGRIESLINEDELSKKMPEDEFIRKTELFISKLSQGQFDEFLYKVLVPELVDYVELPLLSQFIQSIENFELDEAYRLFLSAIDNILIAEDRGIKDYGI